MNLSNLKIGTRLYFGFAAVVALLFLLVAIAYINFSKLSRATDLNTHTYLVMDKVNGALRSLINIETGQRGFALTGKEASLEPYNAGKIEFAKNLQEAKELTVDNPAQQDRLQKLNQDYNAWLELALAPVIKMRRDGKVEEVIAAEQEGRGKKSMDAMRVSIAALLDAEQVLLVKRKDDATQLHSATTLSLVGGGIVAALLAGVIAVWLARNITRPLQYAVEIAKKVAQGDLTAEVKVNSTDETGELLTSLKEMNESLVRIVSEVRSGTGTIVSASGQIAVGTMDLSSRTEEQAGSLEETASSTEELASTVKQNADNARQANQLAKSASEVAMQGGDVIEQVITTMDQINVASKKIVEIISVIDGIAFQTNILALNAAVEAARAGEQGRGFAVVASEVRSLAQRSAAAAKEIKTLIGDSVEKVDLGAKLVDGAGSTMKAIVTSINSVTDIMGEITAASQEQTSGIEQVNKAIFQMDQATQQNAALVEESSAAASSLEEQAQQLAQVVSVFKLNHSTSPVQTLVRPSLSQKASNAPSKIKQTAKPAKRLEGNSAAGSDWEEF